MLLTRHPLNHIFALILLIFNMATKLITSYTPASYREFAQHHRCCNGTLGYAWDDSYMPCSHMTCCNVSETVALIHIDFALGFRFHCLPKKIIKPECYSAGIEVRSTNQDPDRIPRTCCDDAKFEVVVNQWYAAMVIRCTSR